MSYGKKILVGALGIASIVVPLAAGILAGPLVRAQGTRAAFDVASVTPFQLGSAPENRRIDAAHGTVTIRQETVRECIAWAYALNNTNEVSGPEWMDIEEYDITGKAPDGTPPEQLRLMLQRLLEERFKLSLHRKAE